MSRKFFSKGKYLKEISYRDDFSPSNYEELAFYSLDKEEYDAVIGTYVSL